MPEQSNGIPIVKASFNYYTINKKPIDYEQKKLKQKDRLETNSDDISNFLISLDEEKIKNRILKKIKKKIMQIIRKDKIKIKKEINDKIKKILKARQIIKFYWAILLFLNLIIMHP